MSNLASNPWSFGNADVVQATVTGATGMTLNADGTVTMTTTGAFAVTVPPNAWVTVIGVTLAAYVGFYKVLIGAGGTTFTLAPQFAIPAGTAQSGGGTVALNLYRDYVRLEDLSWQNPSAAGQQLDLRDKNGNILWQATATGAGSQNRGKLFWVNGITPFVIQSGVVIATVN